jgi:hypothetical protein
MSNPQVMLIGVPDTYRCTACNAHGVRLWRQYQTVADAVRLLCATCAEENQRIISEPGWRSPYARGEGDQIGWLVPAVPTYDDTFWGYPSFPHHAALWWHALPCASACLARRCSRSAYLCGRISASGTP